MAGGAADLTAASDPATVWKLKLLVIVAFPTNGCQKFVWSNHLFGYCSVLFGCTPNNPDDLKAASFAHKAVELNIAAACSSDNLLRAIFFGLATIT